MLKNKLKGIFLEIPEEFQKWVQFGVISNPKHLEKFTSDSDGILSDMKELSAKFSDSTTTAAAIDSILSKRDIYLDNPYAENQPNVPEGYVKLSYEEEQEAFENGWVDDVIEVNFDSYFLLKK